MSDNKLGHYIFKRLCKDQELLHKTRPRNTYGLYVQPHDIQRYIHDYNNYGIDYTGDDNISSDDTKHFLDDFFEPTIDNYWDEPDGKED